MMICCITLDTNTLALKVRVSGNYVLLQSTHGMHGDLRDFRSQTPFDVPPHLQDIIFWQSNQLRDMVRRSFKQAIQNGLQASFTSNV